MQFVISNNMRAYRQEWNEARQMYNRERLSEKKTTAKCFGRAQRGKKIHLQNELQPKLKHRGYYPPNQNGFVRHSTSTHTCTSTQYLHRKYLSVRKRMCFANVVKPSTDALLNHIHSHTNSVHKHRDNYLIPLFSLCSGVRCVLSVVQGIASTYTRTGTEIPHRQTLRAQFSDFSFSQRVGINGKIARNVHAKPESSTENTKTKRRIDKVHKRSL